MTANSSTITIHMVSSLDGFIAKKDNTIDWMHSKDVYEKGKTLTDEDIAAYLDAIDCYVMGSHTYEQALELGWPYGDVPVTVLSTRSLTSDKSSVNFYSGQTAELVSQLRAQYQSIWMVGGSQLTRDFLQQRLADEIVLTIVPVLLGDGVLFFDFIGQQESLHLKDVTAFNDGMVELTYAIVKDVP